MLTALLQGRAQFSIGELRHRNYLLLYTHVLGIAELLQPHIFQPQYSQSFQRILEAFFDLLQVRFLLITRLFIGIATSIT